MNTWTCWTEINHIKLVHYVSSKLRAAAWPLHEHHSPNISEVWLSAVLGAVVLSEQARVSCVTLFRQRPGRGAQRKELYSNLGLNTIHTAEGTSAASRCFMLSGKNPVIIDRKPHISYTWQQRGGRGRFKQQEASTRSTIMEGWGGKVIRP